MHVYHYCLCLLALVVIINSRYVERSFDNERDDDIYGQNNYHISRGLRSGALERYLRDLIALDAHYEEKNDETMPFERRAKAFAKGDPREFMG